MLRVLIIPVLLLQNGGLVKGKQFRNHRYVGDPINAVKIFNEKEVDELVFLDISASSNSLGPNFDLIADIAGEAFMPFAYGGGITSIDQIGKIFSLGTEKIILNSTAHDNPQLVKEAGNIFGSQSIVVSIDVKKSILGNYNVYIRNGSEKTAHDPVSYAKKMEELGAGELILSMIDREGTGRGYDLKLLNEISKAVDIPVIGLGGASGLEDMAYAKNHSQVSGLAAGDMFIFHGKHKAVLITYPKYSEFEELLN